MKGQLESIVAELVGEAPKEVRALETNPQYRAYLSVGAYVCSYLDHFNIRHERDRLPKTLDLFYSWLKAADDAIDGKRVGGDIILEMYMNQQQELPNEQVLCTLTQAFSIRTRPIASSVYHHLQKLYETTQKEKEAGTMREFLAIRREVGEETARTSLAVMGLHVPLMPAEFEEFFMKVGEFGTILDSAVDFSYDCNHGHIPFATSNYSQVQIWKATTFLGAKLFSRYPFLFLNHRSSLKHFLKGEL